MEQSFLIALLLIVASIYYVIIIVFLRPRIEFTIMISLFMTVGFYLFVSQGHYDLFISCVQYYSLKIKLMITKNYFFDILSICDQQFIIFHNLANSVMVMLIILLFLGSLLTKNRLAKASFGFAIGMMVLIGFSILLNRFSLNYLKEKTSADAACYNKALQYEPSVKALPHLK